MHGCPRTTLAHSHRGSLLATAGALLLSASLVASCAPPTRDEGADTEIDPVAGALTRSFQDGVAPSASYAGTRDGYLAQARAGTNYGTATTDKVDGDDTGGADVSTVIRWDVSSIPPGSTVRTATLALNVTNASSGDYQIYELRRDWSETATTWNAATASQAWGAPGATGTSDRGASVLGVLSARASGTLTVTLNTAGLAVVQRWVDEPASNFGVVLANATVRDGIAFSASEASTLAQRPRLNVSYDPLSATDAGTTSDASGTADTSTTDSGTGATDGGTTDSGTGATDGGTTDSGTGATDGSTSSGTPDPSTLTGKLVVGYQGWFGCPSDGSAANRWIHWFRNNTPDGANVTVDLWPDTSEIDPTELCPTNLTFPDGRRAPVFSSYRRATVMRHFRWMAEGGIDGAFLQRFSSELGSSTMTAFRNQVTQNVRAGAEASGRTFSIMYDISGDGSDIVTRIKNDWAYLVNTLRVTESPRYQRHNGRPVVTIWGFGFRRGTGEVTHTPAQAQALIDWFHNGAPAAERATIMGGIPTYWRNGGGDTLGSPGSTSDPWYAVYRAFDILSPWTVGRYADDAGADNYRNNVMAGDLTAARAAGRELMPVVFPGFSWHNLNAGTLNQIPRRGGRFYWRQLYNAASAGATMAYGAMFDEVDEGTALFKVVPRRVDLPREAPFVSLDIDGEAIPADWYIRLTGEGGRMLRHEIATTSAIPIQP